MPSFGLFPYINNADDKVVKDNKVVLEDGDSLDLTVKYQNGNKEAEIKAADAVASLYDADGKAVALDNAGALTSVDLLVAENAVVTLDQPIKSTAALTPQEYVLRVQLKAGDKEITDRIIVEVTPDAADQAAADEVIEDINNLPAITNLKLTDKPAVVAVRTKFGTAGSTDGTVTNTVKKQNLVTNIDKLVEAEAKIEALEILADADVIAILEVAEEDFDTTANATNLTNAKAAVVTNSSPEAKKYLTDAKAKVEKIEKIDTALKAVQVAANEAAFKTEMVKEDLGLDLSAFNALPGVTQESILTTLLAEQASFTNIKALQDRIDELV